MKPVLTSAQMAEADRHTIQDLKVPGILLMERAAQACVDALIQRMGVGDRVVVLVGMGNNGGDGLAVARLLIKQGVPAQTRLLFPPEKFKGDALTNYQRLREVSNDILLIHEAENLNPADAEWVVDAVFGTGLNRPASGRFAEIFEKLNQEPISVLAVDIPSGLSGSSGTVPGPVLRADVTVTFQCLKRAHVVTPAMGLCGEVVVRDIGIQEPDKADWDAQLMEAEDFQRPARDPFSHKGSFGTLGIIGGFKGMEGAGNLCAAAALRFGVGKVRVLTDGSPGRFHHDSVMVDHVGQYRAEYDALVIGPGLSRRPEAFERIKSLDLSQQTVLWDADGLYWISKYGVTGKAWAITPHPGEAAMLLKTTAGAVQADRIGAIHQLGEQYPGGWILLKGYHTLIRDPRGKLTICGAGNPALAVAGSGDVLSGMIGALAATGCSMGEAVQTACLRHAMAADRWTQTKRDYAMTAEDIIADLVY